MSIRAKTTRTENDLVEFANDNAIPLSTFDHTVNSSGMFTAFYIDPTEDRGEVVFGTDETTGASINGANYLTAVSNGIYSSAVNVANSTKVALYIVVTVPNSAALKIGLRGSRVANPDVSVASDWYRMITDDKTSSSGVHSFSETELQLKSTLMGTPARQYMFEFPVDHANFVSFVFYGSGTYQFTVFAEPIA